MIERKTMNEVEFFTERHGITYSGRKIYPDHPDKIEFDLDDIARALSRLCRFGGHCKHFYSVAQHSALVAAQMPTKELKKVALMHDAPEAYIQDLIRSVKNLCPDYKLIEASFWKAIAKKIQSPSCFTFRSQ